MRHLLLILLGLILTGGVGYFVGYDHGFKEVSQKTQPLEWNMVGEAATTMSHIIGMWQSSDDPKFTREIRNDGSIIDRYEGEDDATGLWMIFTKDVPDAAFPFPFEDHAVYLSVALSEEEKLYYKVVNVGDTLELMYLDRGNILSFTRIP